MRECTAQIQRNMLNSDKKTHMLNDNRLNILRITRKPSLPVTVPKHNVTNAFLMYAKCRPTHNVYYLISI